MQVESLLEWPCYKVMKMIETLYPIAYDSKTLTDAETRYANIERKLLGVVGGLEKFNYFTFGRPVTVLTDHKPLIAISKKSLVSAPPRLQCLLLRLANYNVKLQWIPGKEMIFSNHLSCNIVAGDSSNKPTCEGLDLRIHDVYLNASGDKCLSLAAETDKDPIMQALKHQIIKGGPHIRSECGKNLQDFWNYRDELSVLDGLILKGSCIVVPESCRDEIIDQLHEGHFGIDRTKLHARDSVYWPSVNKDSVLLKLVICAKNTHAGTRDPTIPRDIPIQAWSMVQTDLFTLDGLSFLLVVDATSRFPVVRILNSETTKSVLNALKGIYCDFGLPKRIISDNGPCFKAKEFIEFHTKLGVVTETCSAYNHASVGIAERMVQIMKQIMIKNPQNAWLAMLIFKATMILEVQKSPSELLNSHKYRTNLPMIDLSQSKHDEPVEKLIQKHELKAKIASGKELPKFGCTHPQCYMIKIQIVPRLKGLNGVKVPPKIGKTLANMKF